MVAAVLATLSLAVIQSFTAVHFQAYPRYAGAAMAQALAVAASSGTPMVARVAPAVSDKSQTRD